MNCNHRQAAEKMCIKQRTKFSQRNFNRKPKKEEREKELDYKTQI